MRNAHFWAGLCFVALLLTMPAATEARPLTDAELLSRAATAADRGNYLEVVKHLFAYVQRDPGPMRTDADYSRAILQALRDAEDNLTSAVTTVASGAAGVGGKADDASARSTANVKPINIPNRKPAPLSRDTLKELRKLAGQFTGRNDGRRARLEIQLTRTRGRPVLLITLEDLDRNTKFRGRYRPAPIGPGDAHILRDVRLPRVGGGEEKVFKLLLLHTWNTNYMTGVTSWRGREFGALFERQ